MTAQYSEATYLTQKLVSIESTNIGTFEVEIAAFIEAWLKEQTNLPVDRLYISDDRFDVICSVGTASELADFVIICHMDTVPYGDNWSHAPLGGEIFDGKLYGRGSLDMKSGLAVGMLIFRDLVKSGKKPNRRVIFIASADEEEHMLGVEKAIEAGLITERSLVLDTEPTALNIIPGHKGKSWFEITVEGKPAHGSMPSTGVDAIAGMSEIVRGIRKRIELYPEDPLFGKPSICFGTISGGANINIVAEKVVMSCDMRLAPPLSVERSVQLVDEVIEEAKREVPGIIATAKLLSSKPCVPIYPDSELMNALIKAARETMNMELKPYVMTGYTDSGVVAALTGNQNCLSFGPWGGGIHQTDEYVDIDTIDKLYIILSKLVDDLL